MRRNVGNLDSQFRIVAGATLAGPSTAGIVGPWGVVCLVPRVSGRLQRCPADVLLGIEPCARDRS